MGKDEEDKHGLQTMKSKNIFFKMQNRNVAPLISQLSSQCMEMC